jgi:serine/threonine protein kinase
MEISGSPSYMSPEQFTGEKIDTRSDIYSLGISLYQMLSGELPFRGETLKTVAKQHFYEASKPLSKINPMIPAKVNQLVQKMIAKEPEKRFQNMEDLISDIWEVRQTTAPDKDLVPSVHTISIKRLDYELQEISEKRKKHVKKEKQIVKEQSDNLKKVLFIVIPICAAIAILFLILHFNTKSANSETASKVNAFTELMEDGTYEINDLKQEWEKAKNSMSEPESDYQIELHTRMDLYLAQLRNKSLIKRNIELAKTTKNSEEESYKKLEELLKENEVAAKLIEQKESELEKKEDLFKEKEDLFKEKEEQFNKKMEADKTSDIKFELGKSAEELKEINEKSWKNNIRLMASFSLIVKRKFKEAKALVNVEEEDHPNNEDWFYEKHREIKDLDKLYNAFSMSGSKYAEILIKEGTVKSIIADKVRYIKEDELIGEKEWYNLDPESLVTIAEKVFPEDDEQKVRAYIHLVSGKVIDATGTSNDPEIKAVCDAVCEMKLKNIRRIFLLDTSKAKEEARDFMKELSASEELGEKYRSQLKKLFTGE